MDKRKYQRVALAAGLLFLILFVEGILFYRAGIGLRQEEEKRLGALVTAHPELEQEYIAIFQNKNQGSGEEALKAGKILEEKYGYSVHSGMSLDIIKTYALWMALILAAGLLLESVILVRGINDRQEMKEELNRTKGKLKEVTTHFEKTKAQLQNEENATKTLVTDISHQLKTPLASLKMSYEIADSTSLTEEEREEFKLKEYEELKKLETLLDSLMNLSKLEAKLIQIQTQDMSIRSTLMKAVNSVYMKAFDKGIEITVDEFEDVKIPHDSKWTAEVFVNIMDNGIKYSPSHTKIQIRVKEMVSYVLLEFEDEGMGIDAGETHRIFQRFYRGQAEEVQEKEGSGVGLYLARRIVEEQGGSILARQGRVRGSIFQIMLPKSRYGGR